MKFALCKVQYIEKAETAFNIKLNNHRKDVNNPKSIPADTQSAEISQKQDEHNVRCRGSLMTIYIALLVLLVEHSLVHWYQQSVTVHHVPKCMSS